MSLFKQSLIFFKLPLELLAVLLQFIAFFVPASLSVLCLGNLSSKLFLALTGEGKLLSEALYLSLKLANEVFVVRLNFVYSP